MHATLTKIDKAKVEGKDTPEMEQWIETISSKDYGLVQILIDTFLQDYKNPDFAKKVLKILHYLSLVSPKIVEEQFIPNQDFPKIIAIYITETPLEHITPEVFVILVRIFHESSFKDVTTHAFMQQLFNTLEFFEDQEYLTSVVFIIVCICLEFPANHKAGNFLGTFPPHDDGQEAAEEEEAKDVSDSNPVLVALKTHKNGRYFGETLVKLLNEGVLAQSEQSLECVAAIFSTPALQKEFFFTSDLPILQDILLRELGKVSEEKVRLKFLQVVLQMRKLFPHIEEGVEEVRDTMAIIKSPINDYSDAEIALATQIQNNC